MAELMRTKVSTKELIEITRREVAHYAATSDDATFMPIMDDTALVYAVVVIERKPELRPSWVLVMARVSEDVIIIEEDTTLEKHLVDALMSNGHIPRHQIILAYMNESGE